MSQTTPILTARSMAEFLRASPARQKSILYAQKHPKEGAQVFRTPYYSYPLAGIRNFYRGGNDGTALAAAHTKIEGLSNTARRENNHRVLDQFENDSAQYARKLTVKANRRYDAAVSVVALKLSTDVQAVEGTKPKYLYYNWKRAAVPGMTAETTLAIGYWVLRENGISVPVDSLEYVDLFTRKVHRLRRTPDDVARTLRDAAKRVEQLWLES